MSVSRWSVEQIIGAVRDLSPEAQQEVLIGLPSALSVSRDDLAWLRLAEQAFQFWDNAEDAAYDVL